MKILYLLIVTLYFSQLLAEEISAGKTFQNCPHCPKMITIPPGKFTMGSATNETNRGDDEGPLREVTIDYSFAVGIYEVTFDDWLACINDGGCDNYSPDDNGWGKGKRPVINVSWSDAQNYVAWLNHITGNEYRLLTEAEWEYVARAGTQTMFWWGNDTAKYKAVCGGCNAKKELNDQSLPVGSYQPNPFGLYDINGNAWEWTEDCWSKDYVNHPTDGSAWKPDENCIRKVNRGGSWANGSRHLRSANRSWKRFDHRENNNRGIRVALSLTNKNSDN